MHWQTHILAGWCVGNLFPFNARQRLLCMIAGYSFDLDGFSHFFGQEAYWEYHHKFHNLLIAVGSCAILSMIGAVSLSPTRTSAPLFSRRFLDFPIYLGIYHLHMLMDLLGSGEGWGIPYFWPFEKFEYMWNQWDLYSWQNLTIFGILFLWTLWFAKYRKRTPLEGLMPSLDRQLVQLIDTKSENAK